jgi:hypothetical protein
VAGGVVVVVVVVKGPPKTKPGSLTVGGSGQKRARVRFLFSIFFKTPSPRNAQKRDKKN